MTSINFKNIINGQLISKGLFKVFNCAKNERKYFCISALASNKRSNQKERHFILLIEGFYFDFLILLF